MTAARAWSTNPKRRLAVRASGGRAGGGEKSFRVFEELPRVGEQPLALDGEADAGGEPHEQLDAELGLERFDLLAERRLRDNQSGASSPEM